MSNTITAYFKGRVGVAESVYQNDYGIVMAFDSIDLPAHFDCYFSRLNQEEALPGIGADRMVVIPNSILASPGTVTIHIPIHTGENDSEVEYVVYFKVIGRARPIDDGTPAQMTAIEQALALLQNPITNIEQIVNEALAFTGDTFAEMQEQLDEDQAAFKTEIRGDISEVESDFNNLNAQFQTAVSAVTTDTEVTNLRVGDDNKIYTTAGEAVRKQFSDVKSALNSTFDAYISKNLYHCTSYDVGYRASTDTANGNTSYRAVNDYFPVEPNTTYTMSRFDKTTKTYHSAFNPILVYYDASKTYLGWEQVSGGSYTTPSTAYYIRVSLGVSAFDDYYLQIEKGSAYTSYEPYYNYLMLKDTANGLTDEVQQISGRFINKVSKNLFHVTSYEPGYRASSDTPTQNDSYIAINDYLPVEGGEDYSFGWYNSAKIWIANFSPIITYYDADKTLLGYYQVSDGVQTMPSTAKYIRVSMVKSQYLGNNYFQIEKGQTSTSYEPYYDLIVLDSDYLDTLYLDEHYEQSVTINNIYVGSSASCDFAKVQDAIASIADNSETNHYNIYIEEGTYDLASDFTEEEISGDTFVGIVVPDYCSLIGVGDRNKVKLECRLSTPDVNIAALNFRNSASLENITVISEGCRYTIHDDNAAVSGVKGYKRRLKNCVIKGIDNYYNSVYGAGLRENADWEFENCIFDATEVDRVNGNGIAWFVHNNANFHYPCNIKFKNCRFLSSLDNGAVVLRTISNNANDMITYVQFMGCKIGTGAHGLYLREEDAATYGKGCLFRVSGYANVNDTYSINVTDGQDYSANVDLLH